MQFYRGKFLAVPGERGEDKDGELERRSCIHTNRMLHQVPPEADKPNPLSSGHSRRCPKLYNPEWFQAANEPHYQYAKGQSLLLRENSSRVAFFFSL